MAIWMRRHLRVLLLTSTGNIKRNFSPPARNCSLSSGELVLPCYLLFTGYALSLSDERIAGREHVDVARADGCTDEGMDNSSPENCASCRYSSVLPPQFLRQPNVRDVNGCDGSDGDGSYVVSRGEYGPISNTSSETPDRPHTSSALPSLTPTRSDNEKGKSRATRSPSRPRHEPSLGLSGEGPALPGARRRLRSTSALGYSSINSSSSSRSSVKHDPGGRRVSGKRRGYLRRITQRCCADSLNCKCDPYLAISRV